MFTIQFTGNDETLPVVSRKTITDAAPVGPPPSFILEPEEDYYVIRTKPATITCRAVDADQISIKCVDQWVPPTQHVTSSGVESRPPGRKYIQVGHVIVSALRHVRRALDYITETSFDLDRVGAGEFGSNLS